MDRGRPRVRLIRSLGEARTQLVHREQLSDDELQEIEEELHAEQQERRRR